MERTLSWKSLVLGSGIGAVLCLGGLYLFETVEHITAHPEPSQTAIALPLRPTAVNSSWIKAGDPKFRMIQHARTQDGSTGIWACDGPAKFEWTFQKDERVYILDGSVSIEYRGKQFVLKPGDSALFLAGTKAVWHVPQSLTKTYVLHEPNRAVQFYRRVFGIV